MIRHIIKQAQYSKPVRNLFSISLSFLWFVWSSLALAHHSFAMFDQSKIVTIKGSVAAFEWSNPHVYLHLENKDEKTQAKRYVFEGGSVNMLSRNGWKSTSVKAGDTVTVIYHPLRNGDPGGALRSVQVPDGRVLKTW